MGIYGVISYSITRRLPEIGLRLAVGARELDIIRGEVGGMMLRVSAGMAAGVAAAVALGQFLSSLLHQVSPVDPAVLGAVLLVVFLLSLLALVLAFAGLGWLGGLLIFLVLAIRFLASVVSGKNRNV
jgi:ABC-type antimicrobial peptide transport system permease subunit